MLYSSTCDCPFDIHAKFPVYCMNGTCAFILSVLVESLFLSVLSPKQPVSITVSFPLSPYICACLTKAPCLCASFLSISNIICLYRYLSVAFRPVPPTALFLIDFLSLLSPMSLIFLTVLSHLYVFKQFFLS